MYVRKFGVGCTHTHTHTHTSNTHITHMNTVVSNRSMFSPVVVALRAVHCNTYMSCVMCIYIYIHIIYMYLCIYRFIYCIYIRTYGQTLSK